MKLFLTFVFILCSFLCSASPIQGLLERIDPGASRKFVIEQQPSSTDFFELDQRGSKVVVRGNNPVSIATGIHWYLKYYAHIHLSWDGMKAKLPHILPPVPRKERHETAFQHRYNFNYCTHSYSTPFWDWERWEQEIDWMALHGINLPLVTVGTNVVWRNMLNKLGYDTEEINRFIAGPAFQAWWLMNNLEGWGGPTPDSWYLHCERLQKRILQRMREYGIRPVLPGYSGMLPHDANSRLGLPVADPGRWCGYTRPAFLLPTDENFAKIASLYYQESERLYGQVDFYSMDPFHEGGSVSGVNLQAAGQAILSAMKKSNPKAVWVAQAWQENPRRAMIESLPIGDLLILDLWSESNPQWGDPLANDKYKDGFGKHDWLFCMLLNYGGNVGLHGKMSHLIESYYRATSAQPFGSRMKGVGLTMEGMENNPIMFELLCELPWRPRLFDKNEWVRKYAQARYGQADQEVEKAWKLLADGIYNCPGNNRQQGTHESIFCSRPGHGIYGASTWSHMQPYYRPSEVIDAAGYMLEAADRFKGNNHFEYDLVDIVRQAVAEKGRMVYELMEKAYKTRESGLFAAASHRFLDLLLLQDELLSTRSEFKVGSWINRARSLGQTENESDLYDWNARVLISSWGNREAADQGELHDYAHKEWSGLLKDLYYVRWKQWIECKQAQLAGAHSSPIDFYALEERWATDQRHRYSDRPVGNVIETARKVYQALLH
ncbi:MAG: alpha-N-acetylglucosaminidase [Bacteroides sp.]|nr:alpha-N-acetylglucosaminidase [Bacteroides sp.]